MDYFEVFCIVMSLILTGLFYFLYELVQSFNIENREE